MDQPTIPTLLMRTVIQALGSYPRLSGFVMNILQRLILKKVWSQKVVWEGFIKCCQRTRPQSFAVLMQLPPPQLTEVLQQCPDLRQPLHDHLMSFTEAQRVHIPKPIQDIVILGLQQHPTQPSVAGAHDDVVIVNPTPTESAPPALSAVQSEPLPPGMD
ncbi:unnamed protein product [Acanthoscelides obtectus]|nr:unnamed protein product [Acanthoscelides obtectus]CAK1648025.1 Symplekin [Acanthoscelides obtectus]